MGQLWNEQVRDTDFNWQEIIEKNGLLDEKEHTHYMFRKDRLQNLDNEEN